MLKDTLEALNKEALQAKECLKAHWLRAHKMRAQALNIPKLKILTESSYVLVPHGIHQGTI